MNKSFKLISIIGTFLLFFNIFGYIPVQAATAPPTLDSEGAVLMDADTGQVLYSKNGDERYYPASTTKVLTALVVLENTKLTTKVKIGVNPPFVDGSAIGLRTGDIYTVEELLTGLLLMSGNDCAVALAEHVSGSVKEFSKLMNKKAKALGANDSNFTNPHGLPNNNHYTTPKDLATIMMAAAKNPDFIRIARVMEKTLPPSVIDKYELPLANQTYLINKNSMYYYESALCGKNGYTDIARFTYAVAAKKDGHTLVASFLKNDDKNDLYSEMPKLFEYGFDNFKKKEIVSKNEEITNITLEDGTTIPLLSKDKIIYTAKKDTKKLKVDFNISKNDFNKRSFKKGELAGTAKVLVDGKEFGNITLVTAEGRDYTTAMALKNIVKENKSIVIITALVTLILIVLMLRIRVKSKRQKAFDKKWAKFRGKKNHRYKHLKK